MTDCKESPPIDNRLRYEERQEIERLIRKGLSCGEVARQINRSKNAVVSEVRLNGGPLVYTANKGQKRANDKQMEKRAKLHALNFGNKRTFHMKQRIESLEMQMEILLDTVKELMNDKKNK